MQKFAFKDDTFITAVFEYRTDVAEYIVRMLTGVSDLRLTSVRAQYDIHSVAGRSLRCDLVAEDSAGKIYNIEIQRRSKDAEPERARYHSAMLDAGTLKKGANFTDLPETYVIFITESDALRG
ncbi:MAG: PD-(D/E)XK nuclease family transposase, partial [Pyramidobacter sp.]|nr:PD-(D/E)XK nuclease family transposase [Pyramidobacter sp.]